jgi:hypothetical protein
LKKNLDEFLGERKRQNRSKIVNFSSKIAKTVRKLDSFGVESKFIWQDEDNVSPMRSDNDILRYIIIWRADFDFSCTCKFDQNFCFMTNVQIVPKTASIKRK